MEHDNDPATEYARFHLRRATAEILENIGFTSVSHISLDTLASITRKYFEKLCRDAANRANHGKTLMVKRLSLAGRAWPWWDLMGSDRWYKDKQDQA